MALLGAQLVITLVMISVIQKLGSHFSFARWLLCSTNLIRYLYPTDTELRQLANIPKDKRRKTENGKFKPDTFHIPRSLDIQLETAKVTRLDVVHLRYFVEYQWLIDFAIYSAVVYVLTEVYQYYFPPKNEVNLSMMWCFLVVGFSMYPLGFHHKFGEESIGERSICIVMGLTYLLISMIVLIIDENTLELGLESAYNSFNESASSFLTSQGLNSSGPASKIVLKFCLAVWCGVLGAVFTFPGMRIARMHWDLLRNFRISKTFQLFLNLCFALPFILIVLWIKPVSRYYLTVRIFSGMETPLMSSNAFESFRLILVICTVLIKVVLTPLYLQAYLDMAYHRIEMQKKEAGRITNVDLQKKIAAVFYYLCVATLQYLIPLLICLYVTLMHKTLGSYSWIGQNLLSDNNECPVQESNTIDPFDNESIGKSAEGFQLALENLKSVFTPIVFRGLMGFTAWWCMFLYFMCTSIGLVYQNYFTTL